MSLLKKAGFCLVVALLFSIMVLLVWAAYNYVDGWSTNRNAYAYTGGWYETWQYYHQEYHEGSVQTAGNDAYTEFEGKLGKQQVYYEKYYLDDYEGFYKTFFNYVNWTRTKTDSKTISGGEVEVYIVPGWQP
jgi:hypothetical protein